jgi:hypothetical protein
MPINRPARVYISITDPDKVEQSTSITVYGETPATAGAAIRDRFTNVKKNEQKNGRRTAKAS